MRIEILTFFCLYSGRDLNPHDRNGHRILSPACLPIPPPEQTSMHSRLCFVSKKTRITSGIFLSGKRDSNSRPRPWQGRALPTELFPRCCVATYVCLYLRPESNRHARNGHRILSPARLPIPPLRHYPVYKKSRFSVGT